MADLFDLESIENEEVSNEEMQKRMLAFLNAFEDNAVGRRDK